MSNNEESSSSESSSSDDPARDFVPPPSHVRSGSNRSVQSVRTSPVIGSGNRAALPPEEELAWRAAREQLQNAGAWMQGGADRRQQQQVRRKFGEVENYDIFGAGSGKCYITASP